MDWLSCKLGFKNKQDWYKLERSWLDKNYGTTLLRYYHNSPSEVVMSVYNEDEWEQWRFSSRLPKFTQIDTEIHKCINSLSKELSIIFI